MVKNLNSGRTKKKFLVLAFSLMILEIYRNFKQKAGLARMSNGKSKKVEFVNMVVNAQITIRSKQNVDMRV